MTKTHKIKDFILSMDEFSYFSEKKFTGLLFYNSAKITTALIQRIANAFY